MSGTFTHTGRFWEGPIEAGKTGRYVERTFTVEKAFWRNSMSEEYARRHGLIKKHGLSLGPLPRMLK